MPMFFPRHVASSLCCKACTEVAPINISPELTWSMPVMTFIKVDFPLPDLPMMATNSPSRISRLMFLRAMNAPDAVSYVLHMSFNTINGLTIVCIGIFFPYGLIGALPAGYCAKLRLKLFNSCGVSVVCQCMALLATLCFQGRTETIQKQIWRKKAPI